MKKILFILIAIGVAITLLYSPTGTTSKTLSLTGRAIENLPQQTQEQVNQLISKEYNVPLIYRLAFPLTLKVVITDLNEIIYLDVTSTGINEIQETENFDIEARTDLNTLNTILENPNIATIRANSENIEYDSDSFKGTVAISIGRKYLE